MRVYYLSDLHIESSSEVDTILSRAVPSSGSYASSWVVVAGDISSDLGIVVSVLTSLSSCFARVLYVMGNHEYRSSEFRSYTYTEALLFSLLDVYENIHFLNNRVLDLDGIRVVGSCSWYNLPDNYSRAWWKTFSSDYVYVHEGYANSNMHHDRDFEFLKGLKYCDIDLLVTHFPPISLDSGNSDEYLELLPLDSGIRPRYWVCGHRHVPVSRDFEGVSLVSNPLGYASEDTGYKLRYFDIDVRKG